MKSTRRGFLRGLGLTLGGMLSGAPAARAAAPTPEEVLLWRMIRGLSVGDPFFGHWVLADAYPPVAGGVTLVIAEGREGAAVRVDVVARGEPALAPAMTQHLELFTMDGGGGVRDMPDDLMEALAALAEHLEDNEAQYGLAGRLLTHKERLERYPEFMLRAARELAPSPP